MGHVGSIPGSGTLVTAAPFVDQGIAVGPGGTLFWNTYPNHGLAMLPPGGTVVEFPLAPTGVPAIGGSLAFVPPGFPNAGSLVINSYTTGQIHRIGLTPNGNGTFTPVGGSATLVAGGLPASSIQGIGYVPSGPEAGKIVAGDFNAGRIWLVQLDQVSGVGFPSAAAPVFASVIAPVLPRGICFDPLTGDLFVANGSGGSVIRYTGTLTVPPLVATPVYSASSGSPASVFGNLGPPFAGQPYAIVVSLSGSAPGVMFNGVNVPINPDAMTDFVITAAMNQHPQWVNFMGNLDASGTTTATFMRPGPIAPAWVGITATLSLVVTGVPVSATPAVTVTVVP
jgi:hypothetical protein